MQPPQAGGVVEDFAIFSTNDPHDLAFDCRICWSRIYEYPFAISHLRGRVHNTSWGFEGIHVVFRDWLDERFDTVHSDLRGPEVWDITTPPREEWLGAFDTILSISTLEEVRGDHWQIIRDYFLPQLRPGGKAVITFDIPGFQLDRVERGVGRPMTLTPKALTPRSSVRPWPSLPDHYRVGYLVLTA